MKAFKQNHLSVSESKDTGILTISIKNFSPVATKRWAGLLVADINEHMRCENVSSAEARIAYLEGKLNETNIADIQQAFVKAEKERISGSVITEPQSPAPIK